MSTYTDSSDDVIDVEGFTGSADNLLAGRRRRSVKARIKLPDRAILLH